MSERSDSTPKFQHYVPNFLLRNFAGQDGALWVANKQSARCSQVLPSSDPPRYDAFAENEYLPAEVDARFQRIESQGAPVVRKLITAARAGTVPDLSTRKKRELCRLLFLQVLRVPRVTAFGQALDPDALYEMLTGDPRGEADEAHPERTFFQTMFAMPVEVSRVREDAGMPLLIGDEPCLARAASVAHSGDSTTCRLALPTKSSCRSRRTCTCSCPIPTASLEAFTNSTPTTSMP